MTPSNMPFAWAFALSVTFSLSNRLDGDFKFLSLISFQTRRDKRLRKRMSAECLFQKLLYFFLFLNLKY